MSKTPTSKPTLTRRRVFAGAGLAGAAAAAAALLPRSVQEPAAPEPKPGEPLAAESGGGRYQVTEHVLHYYRTTRV